MPGPAPMSDRQRRRRNATIAMTQLPAEGRKGRTPRWPLPGDIRLQAKKAALEAEVRRQTKLSDDADTSRERTAAGRALLRLRPQLEQARLALRESGKLERAIWADLWKLPQAVAWERLGWLREVAQYARLKATAELGDMDAARESRQHADRLGLSPLSMLRLRWEIAADEVAQQREASTAAEPPPGAAARARLRMVDPGAVARP